MTTPNTSAEPRTWFITGASRGLGRAFTDAALTAGDRADAIAERAVALGDSVALAPMDTPGFRSAVVADPQGGFIAVSARSTDGGSRLESHEGGCHVEISTTVCHVA